MRVKSRGSTRFQHEVMKANIKIIHFKSEKEKTQTVLWSDLAMAQNNLS